MVSKKLNLQSPIGFISIEMDGQMICKLDFGANSKEKPTKLHHPLLKQINNYFEHGQPLTAKFQLSGSPFQIKVWQALTQIPYGKTISYGTLAKTLKTSARAIGQACKRNPIPLFIPCHRVVAEHHIGGFSGKQDGPMLDIKKQLLTHEAQFNMLNR